MPSNTIVAMIAITLIALACIIRGLDEGLLTAAITGIAGLGGYEIGKAIATNGK